jgi:hypothetical protein
MPPAPASIAAAPSARSSVPWNPAVPPPPVTGAVLGNLLADEVTVTVWVTVAVAVWDAGPVAVAVKPGVPGAELLLYDGWPDGDLWLGASAVRDPVGEVVTDGVKMVGVDVDEDEVQAETATGAIRIRAPQQRAVNLAPAGLPAIVPRTFMDSPPAPLSAGQMTTVFPGPGFRNRYRKENA